MLSVENLLEYIERKLDINKIDISKNRIKKSLSYKEIDRVPVIIVKPSSVTNIYSIHEIFHDMEKMLYNELVSAKFSTSIYDSCDIYDDTLPMIRANYGIGILPSLFGAKSRILENNLPWVDAIEDVDKIKEIIEKGRPDLKNGMGAKIFDTYDYFFEKLEKYPKCKEYIKIMHPDLQGPFDVTHLIWGHEIYYSMYDYPDLIHQLISLVTETYIAFIKKLQEYSLFSDVEGEYINHWGTLCKGNALIRNDTSTNLSSEMYEEFVKPYDERVFSEIGGGSIHFCGRAPQILTPMLKSEGLHGININRTPSDIFSLEYLDTIYDDFKESNKAIINYIVDSQDFPKLFDSRFNTGITYKVYPKNDEVAIKISNMLKER